MEPEEKHQPPPPPPPLVTTVTTDRDRISDLPDSVLCHILSFLDTKASVATSILSPRWRYLWQHLDVFNFNDVHFKDTYFDSSARFVRFVNAVLALRKERPIKNFRLSCVASDIPIDDGMSWVHAAIGPHLQELDLNVVYLDEDDHYPEYFLYCVGVFSCPALVSLVLYGGISFGSVSSVHLPSLKNLKICGHTYEYPIDVIVSGCPVLETLELSLFRGSVSKFCIVSSSLRSLTFNLQGLHLVIKSLEIRTPSLKYLTIVFGLGCEQFFYDFPNLVGAHLNFSIESQNNVDFAQDQLVIKTLRELIMVLSTIKVMKLGYFFTKCLLRHASSLNFPKFRCLLRLEIHIECFNLKFIMDLLHYCEILRVLHILKSLRNSNGSSRTLVECLPQNDVITCVTSHLTKVRFGYYETLKMSAHFLHLFCKVD